MVQTQVINKDPSLEKLVTMNFDHNNLNIDEFKTPYFSPNAMTVMTGRLLRKDREGNITESPKELLLRVAANVAKGDLLYNKKMIKGALLKTIHKFYDLMQKREFLPNSPTLTGAGIPDLQMLSACFVLPVKDDIESIFDAQKYAAQVHKKGGGTGFDFSWLRRRGDVVGSTYNNSSGPVSFMKAFNQSTETIKQGGTRRGANMGILSFDHPDIYEFVDCKLDETQLQNFNLSVAIDNDFMNRIKSDGYHILYNRHNGYKEELKSNDLLTIDDKVFLDIRKINEAPTLAKSRDGKKVIHTRTGETVGKIENNTVFLSTTKLYDKITQNAWKTGDPGVVFMERMNEFNPTPHIGLIESTNPCGEQPLLPYESCNLGSINLSVMIKSGKDKTPMIDYHRLKKVVHSSVHFLDNVIDMNKYPLKEIDEMTKGNRKIGLGIMGLHDMLINLGIPYDSEEGRVVAENVMEFINKESTKASVNLAKDRDVFPNFVGSIYDTGRKTDRVRNATTTTIAPTGTLSMLFDASSGVEPLFAIIYEKECMDNTIFDMTPPAFNKLLYDLSLEHTNPEAWVSDIRQKIIKKGGLIGDIPEIPDEFKLLYKAASEIDPIDHVKMPAAIQKHVDNAVSKTINLPKEATVEDIQKINELAFELGMKGVTIYRDGSKKTQVLSAGIQDVSDLTLKEKMYVLWDGMQDVESTVDHLKENLCMDYRIKVGKEGGKDGTLHLQMPIDHRGFPLETYTSITHTGEEVSNHVQVLGVQLSRRLATDPNPDLLQIVNDFAHVKSQNTYGFGPNKINSIFHGLSTMLMKHYKNWGLVKRENGGPLEQVVFKNGSHSLNNDNNKKVVTNVITSIDYGNCGNCGAAYTRPPEGGCATPMCYECGFNACG